MDLRPENEIYTGGILVAPAWTWRDSPLRGPSLDEEIIRQQSTISQIGRELEALGRWKARLRS